MFIVLVLLRVTSFSQIEEALSADARNMAGSGVKAELGVFPTIQIPLNNYGVRTIVTRTKYKDDDALLFYVIKMPNGYGRLFVTKSVLAYEPEGGYNVEAFTIDRKTIKSIDYQQDWQTIRNFPNVNVVFDKDRKQFGINQAAGSSTYGQIDLERYYTAINYLHNTVKDFDAALRVFDELVGRRRKEIQVEEDKRDADRIAAENQRLADEQAEDRKRKEREEQLRLVKIRLDEKLRVAEKFAESRRVYDDDIQKTITAKRPQMRGQTVATRLKVDAAIKALRRMSAAAEVGVIFTEYSSRLIDTKAAVDEATEILPENALNSELQMAVRAYVDAGQAWNKMNKDEILINSDDTFWYLVNQYSLRPDVSNPEIPVLTRQLVLSTLWQRANIHVRNSATLSLR